MTDSSLSPSSTSSTSNHHHEIEKQQSNTNSNIIDEEDIAANHDADILDEKTDTKPIKNDKNDIKIDEEKVAVNHDESILKEEPDRNHVEKLKEKEGKEITNDHGPQTVHPEDIQTPSVTMSNLLNFSLEKKDKQKISRKPNSEAGKIGYFHPLEKYIWP